VNFYATNLFGKDEANYQHWYALGESGKLAGAFSKQK